MNHTARSPYVKPVAVLLVGLLSFVAPTVQGQSQDVLPHCVGYTKLGPYEEIFDQHIGPRVNPFIALLWDTLGERGDAPRLTNHPCSGLNVANAFGTAIVPFVQADEDKNGMGDVWEDLYKVAGPASGNLDTDDLNNLQEFQWLTNPLDADSDNDGWIDSDEAAYWSSYAVGKGGTGPGFAYTNMGAFLDTDGDLIPNVWDSDSDDDDLLDGDEIHVYGTKPELVDTDGDGIDDADEVEVWNTLWWPDAWALDLDGDGLHNLVDADSDGDGLLDGEEYLAHGTNPGLFDSDNDGLLDGEDILVDSSDPRYVLFAQAGIVYTDHGGQRLFKGERSAGTDPLDWDTDGDDLPDGWEVEYGLNPRTPADAGLDPDSDSYNPSGAATPTLSWTNHDEYHYNIPAGWNVLINGVWWDGTYPDDPDTDGDGILDGVEIHMGTNPRDGLDGDPRGVGANGDTSGQVTRLDPTNQNLPEDQMDPTNLQYLRDGRADAAAEANETVEVVDELISAAIAGNVTQALNIVFDVVPVERPVRNAEETVALTQDALVALLKCVDATTNDPQVILDDVLGVTEDTTQCVSGVLVPFLEALLERALEDLPLVNDIVRQLTEETLPGVVATADALVPLDLQATQQALLTDPIQAVQQTTLGVVDFASDPTNLQQAVADTHATAQLALADLIRPTSLHPQFTYDTFTKNGLAAQWPLVQAADNAAATATLGQVHPVAVADGLVYNLYTNRNGEERVTGVPVGDRTCIQLSDTDASTRDASGCDLYATLTFTEHAVEQADRLPSSGQRPSPSLVLETAVAGASFPLEAFAYMQLPDAPYIIVLGYATTDPAHGHPEKWTGTLLDYDVIDQTSDRSISFASSYDDPRSSIPLHVVGGAFEVEVTEPDKPAVPGEETVLEIESAGFPDSVSFDARRSHLPIVEERNAEIAAQLSAPATLEVLHRDYYDGDEAVVRLAATGLPAGNSRATQVSHGTQDLAWTWASAGTTGELDVGFRESVDGTTVRVQDFSGSSVPTSIRISGDALTHLHSYEASAAPAEFQYLAGIGTEECPGLTSTHTRYFTLESGSTLCVTANLGGTTSLQVQELDNQARLGMGRTVSHAGNTGVLIRDGNEFFAEVSPTPTAWDASFTSLPGDVRVLDWATATPTNLGVFDVMLTESNERMVVDMTSVPASVAASFNAATGHGDLTASDYVGSLEWIVTNTGNAPTAATLNDYVRLLDVPGGVESAWRIHGAREVVARVTEDGAWEATGDLASPRNLEVYYEDETHQVLLTAAGVVGDFAFRTSEDAGSGRFHYDHTAGTAFGSVRLDGILPSGNVLIDITGAPATAVLDAILNTQRLTFDASSQASRLEAIYAPGGRHPDPGKADAVVVTGTSTQTPGLYLDTRSTSLLDVTRVPGRIDIQADYGAAVPLDLRFDQSTDADHATIYPMPGTATLTHAPGRVEWSSSGTWTDVTLAARSADAGTFLEAVAEGAPRNLDAVWSTRAADSFQATVDHDGAPMDRLEIQDRRSIPGASGDETDAGWTLTATSVPQNLDVLFAPVDGRLTVTASPTPVGLVETGFGDRTGYTLHAGSSGDAVVFLDEASGGLAGALRASALEVLDVRLFRSEGRTDAAGSVHMDRTTPATLYVKADSASRDAHAVVHHNNAPSDLDVALWPGATGVEGFRFDLEGSSIGGSFEATLEREGRFLGAATPSASPETLQASWQPGSPVSIEASRPTNIDIQSVPVGRQAPSHSGDFAAALKASNEADARFATRLTGVESLILDTEQYTFHVEGTGNGLLVDHISPADRNVIELASAPTALDLAWDRTARTFSLNTAPSPGDLLLSSYPREQAGQRILLDLTGVPSGATSFSVGADNSFDFNGPAPFTEAVVTVDADSGPAGSISNDGVHLQATQELPVIFMRLPGIQDAKLTLPTTGQPVLSLVREAAASDDQADFRLPSSGAMRILELDALPSGTSTYTWPSVSEMEFAATGVPNRNLRIASDMGGDRGQMVLDGAARTWSLGFEESGNLDYTANERSSALDAFAAWHGAAFDLDIQGVPTQFDLATVEGLDSGSLTATDAGRANLAMSTASGTGQIPRVSGNDRDYLTVDTIVQGGMLTFSLSGLEGIEWDAPDGAGAVLNHDLVASIDSSLPTTKSTIVQVVHPDHQTRASLPDGLPASFEIRLGRDTTSWDLGADVYNRDMTLQHQTAETGTISVYIEDGPLRGALHVEPKALQPFVYSADSGAGALRFGSSWDGGFVDVDFRSLPSTMRVALEDTLLTVGEASTQGSGSIAKAQLLVIPDTSSTVNRVDPGRHHLAVERLGKAPYFSLNLNGLQEANWRLPDGAEGGDVYAELDRSVSHQGTTWVVLNGPREDVTIEADNAAPDLRWSLTPSSNTPGALAPSPLAWSLDSIGGTTAEVRFTHLHAETTQMVNSKLVDVQGETGFSATGAEPTRMVLQAGSLGAIEFDTLDGGTALQFNVEEPTSSMTAEVIRGTCDLLNPFQGRVTTHGTGNTGRTSIMVGDGGRVPDIAPGTQALDARCRGTQANVGIQLPTVQDTHWDTSECANDYQFGASRADTDYYVETESGFLRATASLKTDGIGWVGFEFTESQGISLAASDKLGRLEEQVTFPTCMKFKQPVDWISLEGTSVASDLRANVNPQPRDDGAVVDTVHVWSPSVQSTGSLYLVAHVEPVGSDNLHINQLKFESPFGVIDTTVLDGNARRTGGGLHRDHFRALHDKGLDYNVHFTDLQSFSGNVENGCGTGDRIRYNYFRYGVTAHKFSAYSDQGDDCNINRLEIEPLPPHMQFSVDWEDLTANKLVFEPTSSIDHLQWWRSTFYVGDVKIRPGAYSWYLGMDSIPTGKLVVETIFGAAGHVKIVPSSGRVGSMDMGVSVASGADWYVSLGMTNVKATLEWDLDGDTRYDEMPRYIYVDTYGGSVGIDGRIRFGPIGVGLAGAYVYFGEWQLRWGMKDFGVIDLPWMKVAGNLVFEPNLITIQVMAPNGKWYKVPAILLRD